MWGGVEITINACYNPPNMKNITQINPRNEINSPEGNIDKPLIQKKYHSDVFKSIREELISDGNSVHPQFHYLMKVPYQFFITIRYISRVLKTKHTETARREYINGLFRQLNLQIKENHPQIISGKRTVHYVRVNELGLSDHIHSHLLLHIHPDAVELVIEEVFAFFDNLQNSPPKELEQVHVIRISGDQTQLVSYFCKVEKSTPEKHFDYSPKFFDIINRHYLGGKKIISEEKAALLQRLAEIWADPVATMP